MSISAICPVYNEEARVGTMLRCAMWCDQIVVLDKNSIDKTREIASRYTDKVLILPKQEFDPIEIQILLDNVSSEWVILLTASDVIHPQLATEIRNLIEQNDFPYDVIQVPYRRYVLGLETKRSPWHSERHPVVFRKSVARIQNDVHGALTFDTKRYYEMPISTNAYMYHLTHTTVDGMMERHMRYWRAEARLFSSETPIRKAFNSILRSAFDVMIKRKTWLMGWGGIALTMAYMSYWLFSFVYSWELRCSNAPQTYRNIRESILQEWEKSEVIKHA